MTDSPDVPEARDLAVRLLDLASEKRFEETTDLAWHAWSTNPILLAMAMSIWFFQIQATHGNEAVNQGVALITDQMHRAPVDSPMSRITFCEMIYALQDKNPNRMHAAWARLLDTEDWEAGNEVIGLMLSFVGYYLGWFGQEGFLYETS